MKRDWKKYSRWISILVAVLFIGVSFAYAKTTLWKYKDSKGHYHYVDELYKVPEKYRKKAVKVEIESKEVLPTPKNTAPPPKTSPEEIKEKKLKAQWRQKAQSAVNNVKTLEDKVKSLESNCNALQRKWEVKQDIRSRQNFERCAKNLANARLELEKARDYKGNGIYKEAQEAGVPIQWFDDIIEGYQKAE